MRSSPSPARTCDLLEQDGDDLSVQDGRVTLSLPPRRMAVLRIRGAIDL
ncbi:MAG: hypothetical protein R2854_14410 [Caldilineaceae bacterium]